MVMTFTDLLEGANLSEDVKTAIQEAWQSKISETKEELTAELREEFAQRYDHDKSKIVEGVDQFISEKIAAEVREFVEEKRALADDRVTYRKAIREHAKLLDKFVTGVIAKEVKELRDDKSRIAEHVSKLDEFITESLASEIAEFHEDKKSLVEQKVKMVKAGKRQLAEAKKDFITKAANTVEKTINRVINEEVKSFRDDITKSRENDFGRRIFEAFANEYGVSYLNESKELKNLQNTLSELSNKLVETTEQLKSKDQAIQLTESKLRVAQDRYVRKEKINELLTPLGKEKREIMSDLLESVKTEKLEESFNKYLPSVLDGETPRVKKTLSESVKKEHTGNKATAVTTADADDEHSNVVELDYIKKLAGLSK